MLFNTFEFTFFFLAVFAIYWLVFKRNIDLQNGFLLLASYFFYGWWDWRYLFLLFFSTFVSYSSAILTENSESRRNRKIFLYAGILINLGLLGFFKYYNFFLDSLIAAFQTIGVHLHAGSLKIILPVGISFYTFMIIGYNLDVYYKRISASRNPVTFFAFISFFPQLFAGPIGRSTSLLPQFQAAREFNYASAKDGVRQILWGLFKKVVIADSCAYYADQIFGNYDSLPASTLFIGLLYYAFQIYADFSGYSDMAIGTARMLGINLMRNFAYPYFAPDISEFWKRWHISLSTWFRDYLFLPIAYSLDRKIKKAKLLGIRAETWSYSTGIFLTWFLVGLWHGANWTFIAWGVLHGFYLILFNISRKTRKRTLKFLHISSKSWGYTLFQTLFTFILVLISYAFFRADNIAQALDYLGSILSSSLFVTPANVGSRFYILLIIFIIAEWIQRKKEHFLQINAIRFTPLRWGIYYLLLFTVFFYIGKEQTFIYFQF